MQSFFLHPVHKLFSNAPWQEGGDGLYCLYVDDPDNFEIKQSLELIIKKYNNHTHSSTKYTPNEIFYSKDEELFKKVLENIKASFKKTFGEQNF